MGFLITFFLPETKRRSLEDLTGEIVLESCANNIGELSYVHMPPGQRYQSASATSIENSSVGIYVPFYLAKG